MIKILKIALSLLLIAAIILFILILLKEDDKTINIKPIKIQTIASEPQEPKKEIKEENPIVILSKLKVATKVATEGMTPSQEEVSQKILESLKKSIAVQKIEEPVELKPIAQTITTKKISPQKITTSKTPTQKTMLTKVSKKRVVTKKRKTIKKANVSKRYKRVVKRVKVAKKHKNIPKRKTIKSAKVIKKQPTHNKLKIVKKSRHTSPKSSSKLTREEEVALYRKKYASTLEIVKVSQPFELKTKSTLPDAHYFKSEKRVETTTNTEPIKFVKTLGVVAVSDAYETPVVIPKKVELAKEGIVQLPNAQLETEEIKKLKFVKPLEVVEVSQPFETIEANKYLK